MDFVTVIGLIASFVTLGEAGKSWIKIIKDKVKKNEVNLNNWNSEDPIVQSYLDKFTTSMEEKYGTYIFTDLDVEEIVKGFFVENNFPNNFEEKKQVEQFIREIINSYNVYIKSKMSPGEIVLHNEHLKIIGKLDDIQKQPENLNIKKFLRAVEKSKDIELDNIEDSINGEYEIDRTALIELIQRDSKKIVSIQGNAGSGKSVICKKLLYDKEYVLAKRAEDLSLGKTLNEIWDCDIEDAIQWLDTHKLYIYIDAIEFIADCGGKSISSLQEIYRLAEKYKNVYVLTSCRSTDNSAFMKIDTKYNTCVYEVSELTEKEIDSIAQEYSIIKSLKKNNKYSELLSLPFYINLIITGDFIEKSISDENSFRLLIWEKIVCLKEKCNKYGLTQSEIQKSVEKIVFTRAKKFVIGVDVDIIDSRVLNALISEGVILNNEKKIRLKYDIFEDICFERYIDKQFDACVGNYNNFFSVIEKLGRCIYRRYQIWIANKLFVQSSREKFIYSLVSDIDLLDNWKIQTEIGIVKSKYCGLFFDEFQELLDKRVFKELLDVTNLHAFEARIAQVPVLSLDVKPIGAAREYLIDIALNSEWREEFRESLIKICSDYANCSYKLVEVEEKACKIIIGYINDLIEVCKQGKAYMYSKEIVKLFLIVSKMARASKLWLSEFCESMIDKYRDNTDELACVSEEILEAIVKNYDSQFVINLPELSCKVAEVLWTQNKSRRYYANYRYDINNIKAYGLSEHSDYYNNSENGGFSNPFIWHILKTDFIKGFDWAIGFVNKSIDSFANNCPNEIRRLEIYFADQKEKKEYWGNEQLWLANTIDPIIPVILADIVYAIKITIINTLRNSSDMEYIKNLAEYVKNRLYANSNNILMLSIIETIGMNFEKELPGYAIDLVSSMELIYDDIQRCSRYTKNSTMQILEEQMMRTMGIPNLKSRYDKDDKCAMNLQEYMLYSYDYGDNKIKDKCVQILDYLYSLYDEKDCPNESLQIQKMDLRNSENIEIYENIVMKTPKIHGEAKKLLLENEKIYKPVNELMQSVNELLEGAKENKFDLSKMVSTIDVLDEKMQEDDYINIQFEDTLINLIVSALSSDDLLREQREHLLDEWLNRIDKIYNNGSYISDVKKIDILWEQLNEDIDDRIKEQILYIMLDSILYEGHSGLVRDIVNSIISFLRINPKYAERFFVTILRLAEDEMNHQRYNSEYIKENGDQKDFEFVPNMIPRLKGVDYEISNNNAQLYESKKELIVQDNLFKECKIDIDIEHFNIDNYDIGIMCHLSCCGISIKDEKYALIIKKILKCMIDIWYTYKREAHEILGWYKKHYVSTYLQCELSGLGRDVNFIYDILFKDVDFSKFTSETVEFYEDILGAFLSAYVDGFRVKGKRTEIETKIHILEKYINKISVEWVKRKFEKCLFLAATKRDRWNVNEVKTNYNYKDKEFINEQIIKYGTGDLSDVLYTVYMLNIDAMLPEILKSLGECFEYTVAQNEKYFLESAHEAKEIVDMIIIKAFIKYSDEIKKDDELTESFEKILCALIKVGSEKAAVLLDEFRVH